MFKVDAIALAKRAAQRENQTMCVLEGTECGAGPYYVASLDAATNPDSAASKHQVSEMIEPDFE